MSFRLETNQPHPHPPSLLKHHPGRVAHPWVSEMRTAPKRQSADPGLTPELGERERDKQCRRDRSVPAPQARAARAPREPLPRPLRRLPLPLAQAVTARSPLPRPGPAAGTPLLLAPRARRRGHPPPRAPGAPARSPAAAPSAKFPSAALMLRRLMGTNTEDKNGRTPGMPRGLRSASRAPAGRRRPQQGRRRGGRRQGARRGPGGHSPPRAPRAGRAAWG